ncbi:hypothetical protein D9M71_449060 [compost metagenome]
MQTNNAIFSALLRTGTQHFDPPLDGLRLGADLGQQIGFHLGFSLLRHHAHIAIGPVGGGLRIFMLHRNSEVIRIALGVRRPYRQ